MMRNPFDQQEQNGQEQGENQAPIMQPQIQVDPQAQRRKKMGPASGGMAMPAVPPQQQGQQQSQQGGVGPQAGWTPNQTRDWFNTAIRESGINPNDQEGFRAFAQQHGLQLGNPNAAGMIDTINVPDPSAPGGWRNIDVIQGASGGRGQWQWGDWGVDRSGASFEGGGGGGGGAPGGGGGGVGGGPPGVSGALYQQLLSRAQQGTQIDKNDPNIRQQADPYAANIERQRRNYLADTAERSGPLANLQGEKRLSAERAGQASGQFESQLIGRELDNRRQEITHALDSLRGQLTADQTLALQKELGYLNDATQRYGYNTQRSIASEQVGLGRDRLGLDYNYFDWSRDPGNPGNIPGFNSN